MSDESTDPLGLLRPRRTIEGASAVLLPFLDDGTIDWTGFLAHLARTIDVGLRPAVTMDTGHVHLLDATARSEVLDRCAEISQPGWFGGAAVRDEPGAAFDAGRSRRSARPSPVVAGYRWCSRRTV